MKKIILFSIFSLFGIAAICQLPAGTIKTKVTQPVKIINPTVAQQLKEANNTELKQPDLTIFSFEAQFIKTVVINGVTKNEVNIIYSIKNEGNASVPLNKIGWQGYVGYESANPKLIPGGGAQLASPASTSNLDPGAIVQRSFRVTVPFDIANRPLYTFYLDNFNDVNEINEQNNIAQKAIKF